MTESPNPPTQLNLPKPNLTSLKTLNIFTKNIGPLHPNFESLYKEASLLNYNTISFSPINPLSSANSIYTFTSHNEISNSFFLTNNLTPNDKQVQFKQVISSLSTKYNIHSFIDIILNQTSIESKWIHSHPNCAVNLKNCPWLTSAYELDKILTKYSHDFLNKKVKCSSAPYIHNVNNLNDIYNELVEETKDFFEANGFFGYPKTHIKFFKQGNMPLLNDDGKLVIGEDGSIKFASNGNGAIFKSMKVSGVFNDMKEKGIEWIFIGAVDNPLLNMVDETLLGLTSFEKNQIGTKTIVKAYPEEKVGVFCRKNNKLNVIEYMEMPKEVIYMTDENGELIFGESHIMCNLFSMKALEKIAEQELPYHSAHKKVNYIDENGNLIEATEPNAYKFEQFVFDGFRYFNDITILRGKREEEFAPIKNKEGKDSPETAIELYNAMYDKNN